MYLIANSGSIECDWVVLDREGIKLSQFKTMGFNPYFHSTEYMKSKLWESDKALELKDKINHIFFYGAGSSSEHLKNIVSEALNGFFTSATIHVDHDLTSCAYAVYSGKPVISCILSTGSNSCYFDGETVHEELPSLAYIIGDEASANYFAKKILRDFYYKRLPEEIWQSFNSYYKLSAKEMSKKVYNEPNPNVYLAGFITFIIKHKSHAYVKQLMLDGFREFLDIHVKCYANWRCIEVSFLGYVAIDFCEYLKEACELEGVLFGSVIEDQMDNLVRYHLKYTIPQLGNAN